MGLFLLYLSGLLVLFGSIQTESGVAGALIYNKEGEGPYRTLASYQNPGAILDGDQQPNHFYPLELQNSQPEGFFVRPTFIKRGDKGILLDVGDFVMNGGPQGDAKGDTASKSYLLKSPIRGMMRNSG